MKQTIGLLMGIMNEAHRIRECLDYHLPYVDDAVIVIQESDDGTEQVVDDYFKDYLKVRVVIHGTEIISYFTRDAKKEIQVLHFPRLGASEVTLQKGADFLKSDWILYIDADEKFPKEFLQEMHEIVGNAKVDGFWFERDNYFDVKIFDDSVPIEPKTLTIKHPTRDRQFRLTRKKMSWFPPQIHVRCRVRGRNGEGDEEKVETLNYYIYHHKTLEEQHIDNNSYKPAVKIVDAMEATKRGEFIEVPQKISIQKPGKLSFANIKDHIPFPIETAFWIYGMEQNHIEDAVRGKHANRTISEVLFCLSGAVDVSLDNGHVKRDYRLQDPTRGLFIKNMHWIEMSRFVPGTILLCLASGVFDENESIADYDMFIKEVKG